MDTCAPAAEYGISGKDAKAQRSPDFHMLIDRWYFGFVNDVANFCFFRLRMQRIPCPTLASLRPPASLREALRAGLGVRFLVDGHPWLRSRSGSPGIPIHLPQSAGQISSRLVFDKLATLSSALAPLDQLFAQ